MPSLALFGFLLPLPLVGGIGARTALAALILYALLPVIRTTAAGLKSIDASILDAADAMGMTARQRLWRVELPLAMPTIVGGIRIATVTIIGLVTVGGLFDLGGFGNLIDNGLTRDFPTLIVVGVVLSVVLATVADLVLVVAGRLVSPWRFR